jgi:hypothetical protein
VVPAAHHAQKTHQDVEQQRRPDLPTDRVGAVAQEIAQLQALLDLFKEHFDLPPAAIQIGHAAGAPTEIVGQILKDWSKLSSLIENLLNDEEMMKTKSAKSLMYWNTICEQNLAVRIARFVESIENRVALSHLSQIDPEIPSQASHRSFG